MRLVKRWHPDRFADNPRMRESAQEKLKIINSAYEEVKAAISARIETANRGNFSKPPLSSPQKFSEDRHENTAEPLGTGGFFPMFLNSISNRIRRLFSSGTIEVPPFAREGRQSPKAGMSSGPKDEEKDFQKMFNDAVRSKTGRPYRPLKRAKRPVERLGKDAKTRAQTATRPQNRTGRKTGAPVARVEPVSKIKGL
jgi:curved DNA-binding protein CbpA